MAGMVLELQHPERSSGAALRVGAGAPMLTTRRSAQGCRKNRPFLRVGCCTSQRGDAHRRKPQHSQRASGVFSWAPATTATTYVRTVAMARARRELGGFGWVWASRGRRGARQHEVFFFGLQPRFFASALRSAVDVVSAGFGSTSAAASRVDWLKAEVIVSFCGYLYVQTASRAIPPS